MKQTLCKAFFDELQKLGFFPASQTPVTKARARSPSKMPSLGAPPPPPGTNAGREPEGPLGMA